MTPILAFVSGKGGVGKTMLAVAFAKELSRKSNVLVVDLDYFNRGITALLANGDMVASLEPPVFFRPHSAPNNQSASWTITRPSRNLFHISYPDVSPVELRALENMSIEELSGELREFLETSVHLCNADFVVLDCHGGPDNVSFAACLIAAETILVSEPDKITFYGTLNFVRQLKLASPVPLKNIHLVFNKVLPAFSALYLQNLYDRVIRKEFDGQRLLAVFPFEAFLSKEFERTPFLTEVYPHSLLALKTHLMIHDLLIDEFPSKIAGDIQRLPRPVAFYRRVTLGKPLFFLNLDVIMATVMAAVLIIGSLSVWADFLWKQSAYPAAVERMTLFIFLNEHPEIPPWLQKALLNTPPTPWNSYTWTTNLKKIEALSVSASVQDQSDSQHLADFFGVSTSELSLTPESIRGVFMMLDQMNNAFFTSERKYVLNMYQTIKDSRPPAQYQEEFRTNLKIAETYKRQSIAWRISDRFQENTDALVSLAMLWFGIALLYSWDGKLDRLLTYYLRTHTYFMAALGTVGWATIWGTTAIILIVLLNNISTGTLIPFYCSVILIGAMLLGLCVQSFRGISRLRVEGGRIEGFLRLGMGVFLIALPLGFHFYLYTYL